jgi:Zn-dependent protease
MDPGEAWIVSRLSLLVPLLLSLAVHEWAHAFCAWRLGDDTASRQGRLTLDPLAHVDPLGTLLLPLLGVPFGWARPVPVDPLRFHRGVRLGTGLALTAAAGPVANGALAALAALALALLARLGLGALAAAGALATLLHTLVFLNLILGAFNLLPVPPLDGSRIVDAFVPARLRPAWDAFGRMAPVALVALLGLPLLLGASPFAGPAAAVERWVDAVVHLAAG